jgi:hypothetical protein
MLAEMVYVKASPERLVAARTEILPESGACKGPFPLERFTATESSAVVIFTGNDIEEGFSPIERAATMSIACGNRASFRFRALNGMNRPIARVNNVKRFERFQ